MNIKTVELLLLPANKDGTNLQPNGYKVTYQNDSFVFVPLDIDNRNYKEVQEWISEGGTVTEKDVTIA